MSIEPLHKSITVPWKPEAAFRRFTTELATWWPLRSHSVGGRDAVSCVFEEHAGGKIYEVWRDGGRSEWGTVLVWDPPARVEFTWHPGRESAEAQLVELRFTAVDEGTRLDLVQSGWERFGTRGTRMRRAYNLGWAYVLRVWAGRNRSPLVLALDLVVGVVDPLVRLKQRRAASR